MVTWSVVTTEICNHRSIVWFLLHSASDFSCLLSNRVSYSWQWILKCCDQFSILQGFDSVIFPLSHFNLCLRSLQIKSCNFFSITFCGTATCSIFPFFWFCKYFAYCETVVVQRSIPLQQHYSVLNQSFVSIKSFFACPVHSCGWVAYDFPSPRRCGPGTFQIRTQPRSQ